MGNAVDHYKMPLSPDIARIVCISATVFALVPNKRDTQFAFCCTVPVSLRPATNNGPLSTYAFGVEKHFDENGQRA